VRMFTPFMGTFVYAFALILAAYLVATFLGSGAYRSRGIEGDRGEDGSVRLDRGGDLRAPRAVRGRSAERPAVEAAGRRLASPDRHRPGRGGVRVPDADARRPRLRRRSARAGSAYAVNVVGSILGPLVACFVPAPLARRARDDDRARGAALLDRALVDLASDPRPGEDGGGRRARRERRRERLLVSGRSRTKCASRASRSVGTRRRRPSRRARAA
jgi:hypothetical protein